ncbi:glycosyltransferase [Vibrio breoganii]|uniref:Glycosyltransferase n=1 Tax=Vibrio breoganii TaxID=553239 RepID=A0ABX1UDZ2_9VIBR|nr:glycosyltransferase [Vibrio breoganii]NMO75055.1 glycosyltransferase family 4 protein [Vibrio breoganii]NMR71614.1 glycosyltransferase [Vibrio breoganii]OED99209.1 group 1 glycosyl transferase [Vibrio breoganii ZF-29]OEF81000.1 group 1 glycosyl transferase [Vibrio breoganii 1C10]PML87198.1 group 1 glycosyl transferase [Vibrio breoganii]
MEKIKLLAITHHSKKNINPIRPEAAQIIGLHNSGMVDVTVLCNPGSTLIPHLEKEGITVLTDPLNKKLSRSTISHIRRLIKELNIDILHLFNNIACSNGATAAIGTKVKVIAYRGQTGNVSRFDPSSYLVMLHPRLNKIICVAKAIEKDLHQYLWGDKSRATTVYKGHDQSWYQSNPASLEELSLNKDSFKLSMVANLRPRKGLDVFMDALSILPKDLNLDVLLVGADPKNPKIQEMLERSTISSRVHALGYREDAPEVAAASDVIILPTTKREGLCRAVLEANSYGVPAIVSDTGGNAELVSDGQTGIVVPPSDPEALATAIMKLYKDRNLCSEYGIKSKQRTIEKFNVRQGVERTLEIYQSLLR